jgi:threonine dehydrogenase-like Zn-dependent dehydrogenase
MGATSVTIIEPNVARRAFLREHCGQNAVETTRLTYPIVIDAVGFGVTRASASTTFIQPGGVIVHVGLGDEKQGFDVRRVTLQEITFIGAYTYCDVDFRNTAAALFDGHLGSLDWIETRPLAEGAQAFSDLLAGRVATPKIILDPWA